MCPDPKDAPQVQASTGPDPAATRLGREFYARDAFTVARELLGKRLVHALPGQQRSGRIVEVEAYSGPEDQASHARRGPTPRARIMFGPPGHAYVYLIYGMHHGFNVVVDREGYPAAILVRAVQPIEGIAERADGPGRLCRALGLDRTHNGLDLVQAPHLWLEDDGSPAPPCATSPRIGIDFAGPEWSQMPWRYFIPGNPHVSRLPRARGKSKGL